MTDESMDDTMLRLFKDDPGLAAAHEQLESKIAELVIGAPNQWDLLGYVLTEFENAVFQASLNAFTRAFVLRSSEDAES
jgi:hypothetical protein